MLDPAAGLTQVLADGTNTYLYGNGRIAQYQAEMQYFGADGLGSVRQLYDASGQVLANSRYDPYGNVMSQYGEATSVFGYTGEQLDSYIKLLYLRARWYDYGTGRFTQPDPIIQDYAHPQSINGYAYVDNNPVRYVDPSGHAPQNPGDPDDTPGDCTTPWCWQNRWFRAHGYDWDNNTKNWVMPVPPNPHFYDEAAKDEVISEAGITLCGQNCQDKTSWTPNRKEVVARGVSTFGARLSGGIPRVRQLTGGAVKVYVDNKPFFCERSCAPPPNVPTCSGDDIYMESGLLDTFPLAYMDVVHELGHIIDWHSIIGGKRFSDAWQGAPMTSYAVKSPTPAWDRFAEAVAVYVFGPDYFNRSAQLPTQAGMGIQDQMDRMQGLLEGWF